MAAPPSMDRIKVISTQSLSSSSLATSSRRGCRAADPISSPCITQVVIINSSIPGIRRPSSSRLHHRNSRSTLERSPAASSSSMRSRVNIVLNNQDLQLKAVSSTPAIPEYF